MSTVKTPSKPVFVNLLLALFLTTAAVATAAPTFWTGTTISFSHDAGTSTADQLTANHTGADSTNNVWLTRGASKPLYNAAAEPAWNGTTSPVNTMWVLASGPLTSADTLTNYDTFDNVVGQPGNSPSQSVGKTFFVHIVSDDIYLQLTLTEWGMSDGGSFGYDRSTPGAVIPPTPTVSLTNPQSGSAFAAPAALNLKATASVSSGTVTNVQFFANTTTLLGSATASPFNMTSSPLSAGTYALSAVATAAGVSATSSIVNVSVVNPVNVNLSGVHIAAGQFRFNYNVNTGLTYFVESSSNLLSWVPVSTNTPVVSPVPFSASFNPNGATYYRVDRLPNP